MRRNFRQLRADITVVLISKDSRYWVHKYKILKRLENHGLKVEDWRGYGATARQKKMHSATTPRVKADVSHPFAHGWIRDREKIRDWRECWKIPCAMGRRRFCRHVIGRRLLPKTSHFCLRILLVIETVQPQPRLTPLSSVSFSESLSNLLITRPFHACALCLPC